MRATILAGLLACVLVPAGCSFSPDYSGLSLTCGPGGLCPDGFRCQNSDNKCVEMPVGGDKQLGETCANHNECASSSCTDGVCCNTLCDGQCESCSAAGQCGAVTGDPVGGRAACTGGGTMCGGTCDGTVRATCSYPTVECRAGGCTGSTFDSAGNCAMGVCPAGAPQDCAATANTKYCTTQGCLGVDQVETGYDFSCARMTNGSVMCWGANGYGQLGLGNMPGTTTPDTDDRERPHFVPGLTNVTKISLTGASENSQGTACAIKIDKTAVCWGNNFYGNMANGESGSTFTVNATPKPMKSNASTVYANINDISVGFLFTCLLDTSNRIFCAGENSSYQLGDNSISQRVYPVQAGSAADYGSFWSGYETTCGAVGRASPTSIRCWGGNAGFAAGVNQAGSVTTPTAAASFTTVNGVLAKAVGTGQMTSCAVNNTSQLACWGSNSKGQLGKGCNAAGRIGPSTGYALCTAPTYPAAAVPNTPTASPVCRNIDCTLGNSMRQTTHFAISAQSACAVSEGALYCWGNNWNGEFGDGTEAPSYFGKISASAGSPSEVAMGGYHTCVRYAGTKTVKCAGWNPYGQVGNNTFAGPVLTFTEPTFR